MIIVNTINNKVSCTSVQGCTIRSGEHLIEITARCNDPRLGIVRIFGAIWVDKEYLRAECVHDGRELAATIARCSESAIGIGKLYHAHLKPALHRLADANQEAVS